MKTFIAKNAIVLAVAIAGLAASVSAATIGLGTTKDTLFNASNWYGVTSGTVNVVTSSGLTADPLDAGQQSVTMNGEFPASGALLWTYKADTGLRFSKIKISIAIYPGSNTQFGAAIADSTGARIASVDYAAAANDITIASVASYASITEDYQIQGVGQGYTWYTLEINLPESAVSLIDGHTETFNQISVGNWYGAWSPYVGTVELTVVPEPAAVALLGLGALALLRRRRA